MRLFAIALVAATMLAPPAAAFESVYQTLNLDKDCKAYGPSDENGDSVSLKCKGYKTYPVWFSEGDLRQSIFFGHVGDWFEAGAFESFGTFNHFGGRFEWLVEKGRAIAVITRFFVENSEDSAPAKQGQVLVVSKVGQKSAGEACVIGYVDARANKDPNVLARKVAAEHVKSFACRKDEPQFYGIKGPTAGDPMRSYQGTTAN